MAFSSLRQAMRDNVVEAHKVSPVFKPLSECTPGSTSGCRSRSFSRSEWQRGRAGPAALSQAVNAVNAAMALPIMPIWLRFGRGQVRARCGRYLGDEHGSDSRRDRGQSARMGRAAVCRAPGSHRHLLVPDRHWMVGGAFDQGLVLGGRRIRWCCWLVCFDAGAAALDCAGVNGGSAAGAAPCYALGRY